MPLGGIYRAPLIGGPQVWWILFLLLLTTSASTCLQHSRNLGPAYYWSPVHMTSTKLSDIWTTPPSLSAFDTDIQYWVRQFSGARGFSRAVYGVGCAQSTSDPKKLRDTVYNSRIVWTKFRVRTERVQGNGVHTIYGVWRSQISIFSQFQCSIAFTSWQPGIPALLVLKYKLHKNWIKVTFLESPGSIEYCYVCGFLGPSRSLP